MEVVRPLVGGLAAGVLRPQPLGITREALVQPDVAPPPCSHRIAEPLVRQLVGDQPLRFATAVARIGAEYRNPLRLKWYLQLVVGDDDRVAGRQRIRPEPLDEQLHHLRLPTEVMVEVPPQPSRQGRGYRHRWFL